jgi:hypothetical protein
MRRWRVLGILARKLGVIWRALDEAGQDAAKQPVLVQEARRISEAPESSPESLRVAKIVLKVAA